jgi:ribonucleoside-diphosphate reductase alpha chain
MHKDTKQLLSDAKFFEGYARYDEERGRYETWNEAVDRVMDMHRGFYKAKMSKRLEALIAEASDAYKEKKVLGAQRALQFGGEQLLRHQFKNYNCSFSYADRPAFFGECFYILLCGAGVGFSVQRHHIAKLPKIVSRTKAPKIHVVEDSIEGWATALDVLLSSYFEDGGKHPEFRGHRVYFDLSKIRPKGSKISGGFKAPGPDGLRLALDRVEHLLQGAILQAKSAQLRPIQVYDIVMHISDAVLSGGVRRSATICLFSIDDEEMMTAKTGNWFMDNPQRARSNNSAVVVRSTVTEAQFSKLMGNVKQFGEPGFIFVESTEHGSNPCVEIGLYPVDEETGETGWEACNLTEINGGACDTEEKFLQACRAASILGTLQAGYTDFKFLSPVTKKICDREALLGVSITGWMSNPSILFDEKILQAGALEVRKVNREVAGLIGINPAARATCVKPSGNASVLLKTPSGIHPDHAPRYFRNVQMNKDSEVADLLAKTNPHMIEESVWSAGKTDYVVSFPVIANEGALFKSEIYGVNHLEYVKKAQMNWVEYGTDVDLCVEKTIRHNVSNTIEVSDWDEVEKYLFENRNYFAGVSLLPKSGDKIYNQAPFIKVMTHEEIVKTYGTGSLFASGLIVDGLKVFDNLWRACEVAKQLPFTGPGIDTDSTMIADFCRRFHKFAKNYFSSDLTKTEYCLKDVYLLHRWEKIQQNLVDVDFVDQLTEKKFIDVDTMGAAACVGVTETGESTCMI